MIEDAWNDFLDIELKIEQFNEDVSGLQLVTIRHDGKGLYKDLRNGGYVVCSPEHKEQRNYSNRDVNVKVGKQ